jgi:hypothetical protein
LQCARLPRQHQHRVHQHLNTTHRARTRHGSIALGGTETKSPCRKQMPWGFWDSSSTSEWLSVMGTPSRTDLRLGGD